MVKISVRYAALFMAIVWMVGCQSTSQSTDAEIASPVSVDEVKLGSIEQTISTTGTVTAMSTVSLTTEMGGRYKLAVNPKTGRPFMLGDIVETGQVIVELEDEAYLNNLGIEAKGLNLKLAEQNYEKQKSLYDKGGVTLTELSNSEVSTVNARNSYDMAQIQLGYMKVKAPFKGVITALPHYTAGTKVGSGTNVVSLMDYGKMMLEVNLPERYIVTVKKDQPIRVTNYSLPGDTLSGIVRELSPAISSATRTFTAKLIVNNDDLLLRPGMFVKADIVTARRDSVIVISKDVVISNRRGRSVFVVTQGTAEQRAVTYGFENHNKAEITSGLKVNDRLVISGYETLRDRSKVKVIK